ncbi:MAG: hypothetical protein GY847_38080 [Proteobacteria bacterium]|nr:hypothetical protein [Pseudomonadota bacterium]
MPNGITPLAANPGTVPNIRTAADAAKAFETLMFQQLMRSMSKTVGKSGLMGSGFEGDVYGDMFVSAIAEKAAGTGLGLSEMIQKALGIEDRLSGQMKSLSNSIRGIGTYRAAALQGYRAEVSGMSQPPANRNLAQVAEDWIGSISSERWGKNGELTPNDLAADLATEGVGGTAVFNVLDASGYKGHPKCNLFAFEMLRRSGYMVPVRPRSHGWGYPGADTVTRWSQKGEIGDWARIRSGESAGELDAAVQSGRPILLASSAPDDKAGHMAVADRIHSIKRDQEGRIAAIEYSGWEAGSKKAGYGRRVWRLASVQGKGRGGLDRIEVIEPNPVSGQNSFHSIGKGLPGASILDKPPESAVKTQGLEPHSDDY